MSLFDLFSIQCILVEDGFKVECLGTKQTLSVHKGGPVKQGRNVYLVQSDYDALKNHPDIHPKGQQ